MITDARLQEMVESAQKGVKIGWPGAQEALELAEELQSLRRMVAEAHLTPMQTSVINALRDDRPGARTMAIGMIAMLGDMGYALRKKVEAMETERSLGGILKAAIAEGDVMTRAGAEALRQSHLDNMKARLEEEMKDGPHGRG